MTTRGRLRAIGRGRGRGAIAALGILAAAAPAPAQDLRAAVTGDSVHVGDVVPVGVRVILQPGQRVAWPDTLPLQDLPDLENAARVRERVDTLADGRVQLTAVYAVTPWRPGETPLPDLSVDVLSADETARTLTTSLPALDVVSVLPADTAGIEPKPLKGVIGRSWAWLPILLLVLALLALVAALIWWLRRRRAAAGALALVPALPPRERALEALRRARDSGMLERGDWKAFYSAIAEALRHYAAAQDPAWSEDLTTTEIVARIRGEAGPEPARELESVLRAADQVKFARREPDAASALHEWETARAWIESFAWPPPTATVEEAA